MLILTIVLTVTGANGDAGEKNLAYMPKYLAGKARAALTKIIGMIVSFFLHTAAEIWEFGSQHLYIAIAAIFFLVAVSRKP